MRTAVGTAVLAALLIPLVPARADDPTADELLRAAEQKLRAVTETTGPSVACVVVSRSDAYPKPAAQEHPGQLGGFDPAEFMKADPTPTRTALARKLDLSDRDNAPDHGSAGGVVIDQGGLVLTTYYAVEGATKIYVHLPGGRGSYADVHAADARSDLAVLRLLTPPAGLRAVPIGEARLAEGERNNPNVFPGKLVVLMAFAYSSGFEMRQASAWLGSVGNVRRSRPKDKNEARQSLSWYTYGTVLEFNTVFLPGGKGGVAANLVTNGAPLLGLDGELLGLTTTMAAAVGDLTGPVYALPIDPNVRRIVEVLRRGEEVEYGFLGVIFDRSDRRGGIVLTGVTPRGPAALAGVTKDDMIVKINGVRVEAYEDLLLYAGTALAGSRLTLRLRTGAVERDVEVTMAKFKNEAPFIASRRPAPVFGLRVDYSSILAQSLMSGVPPGVVVRELGPNSPAAAKFNPLGNPNRWVITRVNGTRVTTPAEFYKAAEGQPSVKLTLLDATVPNAKEQDLTLP
jgi:serine protease Do